MYREITIKDLTGKKIVLKVYPEEQNRMVLDKADIPYTLDDLGCLAEMVRAVQVIMDKNEIDKIEIVEKT